MATTTPAKKTGAINVATALTAAGIDMAQGYQTVPAQALADQHHPLVEVRLPLVVTGLGASDLAAQVAKTLRHAYPSDHDLALVQGAEQNQVSVLPLSRLSEFAPFDTLTLLCVPPLRQGGSFSDLQEIVAHLRAPYGCPWDREQTLASIRHDLLGETVEVLEAIDIEEAGIDNGEHIAEELGDVLLLTTMMTQIAAEDGRFQMADVLTHIVEKLIRRHPHVFGDQSVNGSDEVAVNWDAIKVEEKAGKGLVPAGPLDGVPAQLPALEKARKLQGKARKAGLLNRQALATSDQGLIDWLGPGPDSQAVGAALWALVALADENDVNAEGALRAYSVQYRQTVESTA